MLREAIRKGESEHQWGIFSPQRIGWWGGDHHGKHTGNGGKAMDEDMGASEN